MISNAFVLVTLPSSDDMFSKHLFKALFFLSFLIRKFKISRTFELKKTVALSQSFSPYPCFRRIGNFHASFILAILLSELSYVEIVGESVIYVILWPSLNINNFTVQGP